MKKNSNKYYYGLKILIIVISMAFVSSNARSSEGRVLSDNSEKNWLSSGLQMTQKCLGSYCPSGKRETLLIATSMLLYGLEWYWKRTNPETYAMINDIRYVEAVLDGDQNNINHLNEAKVEAFIRSQIADYFCPETNWSLWSDCARRFLWEIPGTVIGRFLF